MYIPKHFEQADRKKLVQFMQKHNFGIIVNTIDGKPFATHLPFVVVENDNKIILKAHMAKANPQWKHFKADEDVLVIFSQPHSYISPSLYDEKDSVPTWNYLAVHAYGAPRLLESLEDRISILELSFEHFDPSYRKQWNQLSEDYRQRLLKGIMAFEIETNRVEGKYKLSQNRSNHERANIIDYLKKSTDSGKKEISDYMNSILEQKG